MKSRALVAAVLLFTAAATCDGSEATRPPDIATRVEASAPFDLAADRMKVLHVVFIGSERLTAVLRTQFRAAGHRLTDDPEKADVRYEFDGAYQALRPGTGRTAEVRAGAYIESPAALVTKTGRGASIMVSSNPLVAIAGTLFSNAGDRSGARDSINERTVGDPDGRCLSKCETWLYRQRAVVSIRRIEGQTSLRAAATSTATELGLEVVPLFMTAADAVAEAVALPKFAGAFHERVYELVTPVVSPKAE